MAPRNLIHLESATLAYGTRSILDGVSLGVADSDRIGALGRNGSGTSTLLGVLAGLEVVDSGRVNHLVPGLGMDATIGPLSGGERRRVVPVGGR